MNTLLTDTQSELFTEAFATHLKQLGRKSERVRHQSTVPNIYLDDFLPTNVAEAVLRDFPEPKQLSWTEFADQNQSKLAFDTAERLSGFRFGKSSISSTAGLCWSFWRC